MKPCLDDANSKHFSDNLHCNNIQFCKLSNFLKVCQFWAISHNNHKFWIGNLVLSRRQMVVLLEQLHLFGIPFISFKVLDPERNKNNCSKCTQNSCVYHLFSARVFKVIIRSVGCNECYLLQSFLKVG